MASMKNSTYIITGIITVFVVSILLMSNSVSSETKLSGNDFIEKYNSSQSAVLIDVRTPEEFNTGHIHSAINVDYQNHAFVSDIKKLDTSKTYFIYCRSGNRSGKAASIMKENGFTYIYELEGGILSSHGLLK